ncbi:MAG: sulfurtransferase TusA family protein [Gemmatimonadetes bacterium]|nr:sulfurtransferase TusA family protein [Gemmatimonadota bacterium]
MAVHKADFRGLKCPQPTLRMLGEVVKLAPGDILEVLADCPTFESDLKGFATRTKTTVLWVRREGDTKRAQVRI